VNSENWLTDAPLRTWYGVSTDASGRVAWLDLSGSFDHEAQQSVVHGLSGAIPPEIGSLAGLAILNLGYNRLNGHIPPEIGSLANLAGLFLMHNQLTGAIPPELGDLASLRSLSLYNNGLTGPIPSTLARLASLRRLSVFGNDLSGPIPPELGSLANLTSLGLGANQFTGPIPPELGDLASLQSLSLYNNGLTGPIPAALGTLAALSWLDVSDNHLSGTIPPELGFLAYLSRLNLCANLLTGPIPPELGDLANLTRLTLSDNRLTGTIPSTLGNLANLTGLHLWRNQLTGPIPPSFSQLAALRYFSIGENTLCAPGTSVFAAWLQTLEYHDATITGCNAADVAALKSLYEAAGGTGWTESGGWPDGDFVEDWHGVTADSLGRVTELDLARNGLEGELPPGLGAMTQLNVLRIGDNVLSGRLPLTLERVPLREFHYANTDLCAPADESFQAWLDGIPSHVGTGNQCAPLSDRDILALLYEATGGPDWVRNRNWLTEAPLWQWDGIFVDDEGNVVRLFAENNNLAGSVPVELGSLGNLTELNLRANQLTGPIPAEFGDLGNLKGLFLGRNQLTGPIPAELGNLASLTWLDLGHNQLTGPIPVELGNLSNLTGLLLGGNALSGPIPAELGNLASLALLWLYTNDLSGPIPAELGNLPSLTGLNLTRNSVTGTIPPELGNLGRLTALALGGNALAGEIPPELGNITGLKELYLWGNGLTGEIPAELGNLSELVFLYLSLNQLTGPIPPEFGNLAKVTRFHLQGNALSGAIPGQLGRLSSVDRMLLWGNDLTGPIPPELGNLSSASILSLSDNNLSGPIPAELGNLGSVTYLSLANNALSGSLPPELGALTTVEKLFLEHNDFEGPLPPGLGGMASLKELGLTGNAGVYGALPGDMTDLHQLDALLAGGTGLCAPTDPDFQTWLDGVFKRRIAPCAEGNPPAAYLVQAVQSRMFPVPLVAGQKALLRVFPTARKATSVGIPLVRARFYLNGRETHVENIPGKSRPIPTEVDESSLSKSANAEIPAGLIQPGLEMVIEVDPEGTLDEELGVAKRIPETGRLAVDVRTMPPFDLTLIPFIWSATGDSSIVDLVKAMAADPGNHEMLSETRALLPIGDLVVTAHEPVVSSSNSAFSLLSQTTAIRAMEGGTGHYKGMMSPPVTGAGGVARLPGRSSFSQPYPATLAHELGHNLYLRHAPCGGAGGPDPSFPYSDGSIGAWGYDFRDGGSLVHPATPDLMSYCGPEWISDFYFTNALRFRLSDADSVGLPHRAPPTRSLLLWGGVGADSVPFLEPAFVVDARPELPRADGEHRLTGRTGGGDDLFSLSFAMPVVADGDGSSSFAFVVPAPSGWDGALATITLAGPGGSVTLDADTDLAMAILRNPRTGQVRGILR
ncbi:MAG: hypothetical protein F4123_09825, partial [Gemmatimonadetes bacterium]|nr:hypothetical protein [Gemmatimonadota bacterium]